MSKWNSLIEAIGNTPLICLNPAKKGDGAAVFAKLEFMNPGGSIKDRTCKSMLESMEWGGMISQGDHLVEAGAGNTAVSLAMLCAVKGYRLTLIIPDNVSPNRRRHLANLGARILFSPSVRGMRGAVDKAEEVQASRRRMVMINQFDNPANPEAHRNGTGPEIVRSLGEVPDVFVAGVGTGGTITGVGEYFKEQKSSAKIVAVEPSESCVLSGGSPGKHKMPGIGAGFIPRILKIDLIDEIMAVTYQDAVKTMKHLAANNGLNVGVSSGAVVHAAFLQAERLGSNSSVVTILYDSGERYL